MGKTYNKPVTLKGSEVELLSDREKVPGYEGWYVDYDEQSGEFMSSKSAMVDFELYLYDADDNLVGTAIGGYYNEGCGLKVNYDLTFYPPEPETEESKFNDLLKSLASNDSKTIKQKIEEINKYGQ